MLDELLYKDRVLLDYFDKNLSIIQTADWPYFRRYRQAYQNNIKSLDAVNAVCGKIKDIILERGAVSSSDIGFDGAVRRCLALTTNGNIHALRAPQIRLLHNTAIVWRPLYRQNGGGVRPQDQNADS